MSDDFLFQPPSRYWTHTIPLIFLAILAIAIVWFAATAPRPPIPSPVPVQTTRHADVREQRLQLEDDRVVTCLVFPTAVSCDWTNAHTIGEK